jgi:hypothetical protein
MIPNAKMDALLNAPPKKVSNRPNNPPVFALSWLGSMPGRTTKEPNLKIAIKPKVLRILILRSSIAKMFFNVVINFFIQIL